MKLTNNEIIAMTTLEILNLRTALWNMPDMSGREWTIMVVRNLMLLDKEIEVYQKAWEKIRKTLVEKDEKGVPIVKDDKLIPIDEEKFKAEHEALLNRDVKLELVKIKEKDIPQEATPKMLLGVWNYVIEE